MSRSNHPTEKEARRLWSEYDEDSQAQFWAAYAVVLATAKRLSAHKPEKQVKSGVGDQVKKERIVANNPEKTPESEALSTGMFKTILGGIIFGLFVLLVSIELSGGATAIGWFIIAFLVIVFFGTTSQNPSLFSHKASPQQMLTKTLQTTPVTVLSLKLSGQQITLVPPEIKQFKELEYINLNHNQLKALPRETGQLKRLVKLLADNNQLAELPPEIGRLASLNELSVGSNQLTALPGETGYLTGLRILRVNNNQLTLLPVEIKHLTSLRKLYAQNNNLMTIPAETGQLHLLTELDLSNNQLVYLPKEIKGLVNLRKLHLQGNPITAEAQEKIKEYLPNCKITF